MFLKKGRDIKKGEGGDKKRKAGGGVPVSKESSGDQAGGGR